MISLLLIGDSNLLVSATSEQSIASVQPKSITFASEIYRLLGNADETVSIFNHAVWGSTLLDFLSTHIVAGPFITHGAKTCIIGFGTNDANYFYSLNSHIISPALHRSLLEHLVSVIYASTDICSIIILPIPPVCIKSDSLRNLKINQAINAFNREREALAQSSHSQARYLSTLRYDMRHISNDGYHLNAQGIKLLAQEVCTFLLHENRKAIL